MRSTRATTHSADRRSPLVSRATALRRRRAAGARRRSAGAALKVGIKFDQPGLGLKNPDGTFTGFDVDVATYVAEQLGVDAGQDRLEGGAVRAARDADPERPGRLHRRHLLDHRRPQGEGRLRRAVLHRRPGPAGARRTTPTSPARTSSSGKKLCSVTGSTSAQKVKDKYAQDVQLQEFDTYSECVEALTQRRGRRRDHRRRHPRRLRRAAAQASSRSSASRSPTENYGIGLKKGDTEPVAEINDALEKMIATARWEKAVATTPSARPATRMPAPPRRPVLTIRLPVRARLAGIAGPCSPQRRP